MAFVRKKHDQYMGVSRLFVVQVVGPNVAGNVAFFLSAFLTLFRERQPPNGGCREPYLAPANPIKNPC